MLDATENECDGEKWAEIRHRIRNCFTICEQVADVVAKEEDHNSKDGRDCCREPGHNPHREKCRLGVAGTKLIAHSYTEVKTYQFVS